MNKTFHLIMIFLCALMSEVAFGQTNLIPNSDFNIFQGTNIGFGTEYQVVTGQNCLGGDAGAGKVTAGSQNHFNANYFNGNFFNTEGHGGGHFLIVNGFGGTGDWNHLTNNTPSNKKVLEYTIPVQPYSFYEFTFWSTHLSNGTTPLVPTINARVTFRVTFNDVQIGSDWSPEHVNNTARWCQFPTSHWYSGSNTSVTIRFYDRCVWNSGYGDDFGIDDVSFVFERSYASTANDDNVDACVDSETIILFSDLMANDNICQYVNTTPTLADFPHNDDMFEAYPSVGPTIGWKYKPKANATSDSFTYKYQYTFTYQGQTKTFSSAPATVHITVHPLIQAPVQNKSECDSYTWYATGQTYTTSGIYTARRPNPNGCDSIVTLNLTILHKATVGNITIPEGICPGDSFSLTAPSPGGGSWVYSDTPDGTPHTFNNNNVPYSFNGKYLRYAVTNTCGTAYSNAVPLIVHQEYEMPTQDAEACTRYTWDANGQTYTSPGIYSCTLNTVHGCDSTVSINLALTGRQVITTYLPNECDSYTWTVPGHAPKYYSSSTPCRFIDSIVVNDQGGCDTIYRLDLFINPSSTAEEHVEDCDEVVWYGNTYTVSTVDTYVTTNEYGCPHTITGYITVNSSTQSEETPEPDCDVVLWHGQEYTGSGDYDFDTINEHGCSHVIHGHITVHHSDTITVGEPVVECDSFTMYGHTFYESGWAIIDSTNNDGCPMQLRRMVTINHSQVETFPEDYACGEYQWLGRTFTESGLVQITDTLTEDGCPLTLQRNVTIYPEYLNNDPMVVTACSEYIFQGDTLTESTTKDYTLQSVNGCDSIVTLNLTISTEFLEIKSDQSCNDYVWTIPGRDPRYYVLGEGQENGYVITDTIQDFTGSCDSTWILQLTLYRDSELITVFAEGCDLAEYNGLYYEETGDYPINNLYTVHGCDSLVTVHVDIYHDVVGEPRTEYTCSSIPWYGQTCYPREEPYYAHVDSYHGCDSLLTLYVREAQYNTGSLEVRACESYLYHGHDYEIGGPYEVQFENYNDCDSLVTLTVLPLAEPVTEEALTACGDFEWHGNTITADNQWHEAMVYDPDIDCNVKHLVFVNEGEDTGGESITPEPSCEPYEWHGDIYERTGDYIYRNEDPITGCAVVDTLHLTITGLYNLQVVGDTNVYITTHFWSGKYIYYVESGDPIEDPVHWTLEGTDWPYDSLTTGNSCWVIANHPGQAVLTAQIGSGNCNVTTIHINGHYFAVDEFDPQTINIFPNPAHNEVTISANTIQMVRVYNMMGQLVRDYQGQDSDQVTFSVADFPPTLYVVEVTTALGTIRKPLTVSR